MPFTRLCFSAFLVLAFYPRAYAATPADFEGEYVWQYIDCLAEDAPHSSGISVQLSLVDASTARFALDFGSYRAEATADFDAGTLTLDTPQFLAYDAAKRMDVYLYHGHWTADGANAQGAGAAVFVLENGNFVLPPDETLALGNSSRGYLMMGRENVLASTAGVPLIEASATMAARYFRLDGVELKSGTSSPGIYVRRCGTSSTLIVTK